MKIYSFILMSCLFLISCGSKKEIVNGFKIGMSEDAWKSELKKNIDEGTISKVMEDSISGSFSWNLKDTTFQVHASFNSDGVPSGKLRVIYFGLNNKDGFMTFGNTDEPIDTFASYIDEKGQVHPPVTEDPEINYKNLPNEDVFDACLKTRFDAVKKKLELILGKPDSVIYEFGTNNTSDLINKPESSNRDTILTKFYYTNGNVQICLAHNSYKGRTRQVPFEHYGKAYVLLYSNNYEKELETAIKERKRTIRPETLFRTPVIASIVREKKSNGSDNVYLQLNGVFGSISIRELSETRKIVATKGVLRITDNFGDFIEQLLDIELEFPEPISRDSKPGLNNVISESFSFNPQFIKWQIGYNSPLASIKLQQAMSKNITIKAEYIAQFIKFSDGSVLK